MAKKLTRAQNEELGATAELSGKLNILAQWLKNGKITRDQYNEIVNRLINRAMKKAKPSLDLDDKQHHRTVKEGEIQRFIDMLRKNLNSYLSNRNKSIAKLPPKDIERFRNYIENYPWLKSKVNRLLVVGLRYPDKDLNEIAENHIKQNCIIEKIDYVDSAFWLMLWEDGNLVPMNAVRLMLVETKDGYKLNPCFNQRIRQELIPLIKFQRNKEVLRLQWAMSLDDTAPNKPIEIERKQRRLDAFEALLELISK